MFQLTMFRNQFALRESRGGFASGTPSPCVRCRLENFLVIAQFEKKSSITSCVTNYESEESFSHHSCNILVTFLNEVYKMKHFELNSRSTRLLKIQSLLWDSFMKKFFYGMLSKGETIDD